MALNAYSSVKIQARRTGVSECPAQLISQSVPVHCPASYHSVKAQSYSTSGFNKTWLPRKRREKGRGRSMQSSSSYQHQLL